MGFVSTRIWESERNRPDELSATGADVASEEARATREMFKSLMLVSMPPERVAGLVHDAIRDGTFYIHTHENVRAAVEGRMQGILDAKAPAMPEGGHAVFGK